MTVILTIVSIILMAIGLLMLYGCLRIAKGDEQLEKALGPKKYFSLLLQLESYMRIAFSIFGIGVIVWVMI